MVTNTYMKVALSETLLWNFQQSKFFCFGQQAENIHTDNLCLESYLSWIWIHKIPMIQTESESNIMHQLVRQLFKNIYNEIQMPWKN
jgi:hypothetical protein